MPSESSSLDEKCRCGHPRRRHLEPPGAQCVACSADEGRSWRHDFVPADAETAGESGLCEIPHESIEEEDECERRRLAAEPEPEAPELKPCDICGDRRQTNEERAGFLLCEPCIYSEGQPYCGGCGSKTTPFALAKGSPRNELRCLECSLADASPPRRPPYAVAYELQDGSAFEVALPGDATVRADDGLLIIHHAQSPVKGLVQVKPWGGQ